MVVPSGGEAVAHGSSVVNGELTGSTSMPNLFSPTEERTSFPGANQKIGILPSVVCSSLALLTIQHGC